MKTQQIILRITMLALFAISSCKKETGYTPTCTGTKSFATDVNPIIQTRCANSASCHAAGSSNGPGPLLNHFQVSAAASRIKTQVMAGTMPQGGSLSTDQKDAIICWIDDGAQNN